MTIKPSVPDSATTGRLPRELHHDRWYAPAKLPIAKNGKATAPTALPVPALTSVPEPQPRTTCMHAPNTNAPPIIATPIGACAPFSSDPCVARSGNAATATMPIQTSCAIRPDGSRIRIMRRHGPVKPKRNPSSASPNPSPISSSSPYRGPASSATVSTAAPTPDRTIARDSRPGAVGMDAAV